MRWNNFGDYYYLYDAANEDYFGNNCLSTINIHEAKVYSEAAKKKLEENICLSPYIHFIKNRDRQYNYIINYSKYKLSQAYHHKQKLTEYFSMVEIKKATPLTLEEALTIQYFERRKEPIIIKV